MAEQTVRIRMNHPVIVSIMILAIIAFMYFAAEVLRPLALALLLCMVLAPLASWLERRGLPRMLSVVLTVGVVLGGLGGVGYVVIQQLGQLAQELTEHREEFKDKLRDVVAKGSGTAVDDLPEMVEEVTKDVMEEQEAAEKQTASETDLTATTEPSTPGVGVRDPWFASSAELESMEDRVTKVEVVDRPSIQERFGTAVGPLLEPAAIFGLVLVLTLFMLATREDLLGRVIQVIGTSHISLTTRTLEEAGRRISRYLTIFSAYNATCGAILGLGLWWIGIPYAVLWGFLAAVLRFIPYVGPWTAFTMPLFYSIVFSEGWREPAMVAALFVVVEAISEYVLEPVIYGRTAGITAVGLLVSAMFWTWLWGAPGLLLSTPLTVCLAVLGKYVPALKFFATMLGEEAILDRDIRFYQRLLAHDQDGAIEVVEEAADERPRSQVFDEIIVPVLSRSEADLARGKIDEAEHAFIWRTTRNVLSELEARDHAQRRPDEADRTTIKGAPKVVGVATNDDADAMVLRMLRQLLEPDGVQLEIIADTSTPLETSDLLAEEHPRLVLLSHLPPVGLTSARYLVRRLKKGYPKAPLWVGRWGESGHVETVRHRLTSMGADRVVLSLGEARDRILEELKLKPCTDIEEPAVESTAS